jgi:hypothetical protein
MLQKRNPYDLIAVNLRIAWSDAATGPLPNRIRRLLEQLADQDAKQPLVRGNNGVNGDRRRS